MIYYAIERRYKEPYGFVKIKGNLGHLVVYSILATKIQVKDEEFFDEVYVMTRDFVEEYPQIVNIVLRDGMDGVIRFIRGSIDKSSEEFLDKLYIINVKHYYEVDKIGGDKKHEVEHHRFRVDIYSGVYRTPYLEVDNIHILLEKIDGTKYKSIHDIDLDTILSTGIEVMSVENTFAALGYTVESSDLREIGINTVRDICCYRTMKEIVDKIFLTIDKS